ncbi:hypothetical protein ACFYWX_22930 [Streptomyces sp. NPDC002888]|uniref:hypothetical protein n=1 Tax=Streptomyces sp. NPDC002888 TaxID=3364668 RepID=UPI0036D0D874
MGHLDAPARGDDLPREALRHLGDHDADARALDRRRRATALAARSGAVVGTLSRQMLLAVPARDAGDEAGDGAPAAEGAGWTEAVGAVRLAAQASAFLAGTVPTAAPPSESVSDRS